MKISQSSFKLSKLLLTLVDNIVQFAVYVGGVFVKYILMSKSMFVMK